MWPSRIDASGRIFGSVIYEEMGSDDLVLNFMTAQIPSGPKDASQERDYPQQPVPQSWMVDYPLLAYKNWTPMNKEITIVHMAMNMP